MTSPLQQELLTLFLTPETTQDIDSFDETLFSLAGQDHRPLQLLVSVKGADRAAVGELLEKYQPAGSYQYQLVADRPSPLQALGRYWALLEPGWKVYPHHYSSLVDRLRRTEAIWALGKVKSAVCLETSTGETWISAKIPFPLSDPDLPDLVSRPHLASAVVVDRMRLKPPEGSQLLDDPAKLVLKLACLQSTPALAVTTSCERQLELEPDARTLDSALQTLTLTLEELVELIEAARRPKIAVSSENLKRLYKNISRALRDKSPTLHGNLRLLASRLTGSSR